MTKKMSKWCKWPQDMGRSLEDTLTDQRNQTSNWMDSFLLFQQHIARLAGAVKDVSVPRCEGDGWEKRDILQLFLDEV
jgi:hypothetical protein